MLRLCRGAGWSGSVFYLSTIERASRSADICRFRCYMADQSLNGGFRLDVATTPTVSTFPEVDLLPAQLQSRNHPADVFVEAVNAD